MNKETYRVGLAGTLAMALVFRLLALVVRTEWRDERITMAFLEAYTPIELVGAIPLYQPHPPLYYVLVDTVFALTGESLLVAQLLSVLAGGGTVVALAWLGTALYSRRVGLMAGALGATHPYLIYLSQPARMYALLGLLSVLTVGAALRYRQTPTVRWAGAFGVLGVLSVYTHYFGAFALATGLVVTRWDRRMVRVGVGQALASLPLAAVVVYRLYWPAAIERHADPATTSIHLPELTHVDHMPELGEVLGLYTRFGTGRILFYTEYVTLLVVALAIGAACYGAWHARPSGDTNTLALATWAVLPVGLGLLASMLAFPMWRGRYYVGAGVAVVLLVARGCDRLPYSGVWLTIILATTSTTWWFFSFVNAYT